MNSAFSFIVLDDKVFRTDHNFNGTDVAKLTCDKALRTKHSWSLILSLALRANQETFDFCFPCDTALRMERLMDFCLYDTLCYGSV